MENLTPKLNQQQLQQNIDALVKQGAPRESVQSYINNYVKDPTGYFVLKGVQQEQTAQAEGARATEFLNKSGAEQIFTKEFAKSLPRAAYDTIVGNVLKFVKSGVEAPQNIVQGLQGKEQTSTPGVGPMGEEITSFQTDFQNKTIPQVLSGEKTPLGGTISGVGGPVLAAAETLGAAQSLKAGTGAVRAATEAAPSLIGKADDFVSGISGRLKGAGRKIKETIENIIRPGTQQEKVTNFISPELNARKAGEAITSGRGELEKGTVFDVVTITPDSRIVRAGEVVQDIVDPSKTYTENINSVRNALSTEAESLKTQITNVDHPYVFKELNSRLKQVELPISFKNDKQQAKTLNEITETFMKIARDRGGKTSSLLDARKEFDRLVDENFPNLYEAGKPTTAYKAITKTRDAINDFIEDQLPDVSYKASLRKQSSMYDAIDGMKANAGKEAGKSTNQVLRTIQDFRKKNPRLSKAVESSGGLVIGLGAAKELGLID